MQPAQKEMNGALVWVFLAMIILLALSLRVVNLGGPDFGIDEIFHVYAAQGLIEKDTPELPGGILYTRGLVYTHLVAIAGKIWGLNEETARLPSVVFGISSILMVFFIGRYWYSSSIGLIAAFLVAVLPNEILYSRASRMYSMFQFFFLVVIFLFYYGFEYVREGWIRVRIPESTWCNVWRTLEVSPILLVITCFLFFFTTQIHRLMLPAMSGPLMYVLFMALITPWLSKVSLGCKVKYVLSALLIAVTGIGLYLFNEELVGKYLKAAHFVPTWLGDENVNNWRFYKDFLASYYPILFTMFPLAGLLGFFRNPRVTLYLFLCFLIPLLLHSFWFSLKTYRYIFHLLPLMVLLFSIGFSEFFSFLYGALTRWMEKEMNPQFVRALVVCLLSATILFVLSNTRWFSIGMQHHRMDVSRILGMSHSNWSNAMQFIREHGSKSDVVITPWPLLSRYYGGGLPLYYLNDLNPAELNRQFVGDAMPINNLGELKNTVEMNQSGWMIFEKYRFNDLANAVPKVSKQWIEDNFKKVSIPSAQDMLLWRWSDASQTND